MGPAGLAFGNFSRGTTTASLLDGWWMEGVDQPHCEYIYSVRTEYTYGICMYGTYTYR